MHEVMGEILGLASAYGRVASTLRGGTTTMHGVAINPSRPMWTAMACHLERFPIRHSAVTPATTTPLANREAEAKIRQCGRVQRTGSSFCRRRTSYPTVPGRPEQQRQRQTLSANQNRVAFASQETTGSLTLAPSGPQTKRAESRATSPSEATTPAVGTRNFIP